MQKIPNIQEHFKTPEGYFEDFQKQIMQKIAEEGTKTRAIEVNLVKKNRFTWMHTMSVAAGIALVAAIGITLLWLAPDSSFNDKIAANPSAKQATRIDTSTASDNKGTEIIITKDEPAKILASNEVNTSKESTSPTSTKKQAGKQAKPRKADASSSAYTMEEAADLLLIDDQDIHQMIFESM